MPCWQVQKLSVKFQAKNIELLINAIESLSWNFEKIGETIKINYGDIVLDLAKGKAECYDQNGLNKLKVAYSTKAIEKVAAKKNWLFKKAANNKMQLKRF